MISIDYQVSYPCLTPSEEARLAKMIAEHLRHHIVTIACRVTKDNGHFINSIQLDVVGGVTALKKEGAHE